MLLRTLAVLAALFVAPLALAGEIIFGYATSTNTLITIDSSTPGTIVSSIPLTGVLSGEAPRGFDFHPTTGQLFASMDNGTSQRLVTINTATGAVTQVGGTSLVDLPFTAGFAFDPSTGLIRTSNFSDANVRINPSNGTTTAATPYAYAAGDVNVGSDPFVVHLAYSNLTVNGTTLYGIDVLTDSLVRIGGVNGTPSADGGLLTTIGPLGINALNLGGFDISPTTGTAFAALSLVGGNAPGLYTINLQTGAATFVGNIQNFGSIHALAVAPADAGVPEPSAFAMIGIAAVVGLIVRRNREVTK